MLRFPFHRATLFALATLARGIDARMEKDDDDDEEEERGSGRRSHDELAEQVRRLVEKRGGGDNGAQAVALMLLEQNQKVREGRRKYRERAETAEAKVPKDGQVVISKEDAAEFEKFKVLGKADEVKTKVEKSVTLEAEKKLREGDETVTTAAGRAGLPNAKLLAKLARPDRENFIVEVRDETKDGKSVKVAYARANKEGSAFKPLAEFAKNDLAEYYPALIAKGADGSTGATGTAPASGTSGGGTPTSVFTPFPEMQPTGTAPAAGGDKVNKFIEERNKAAAARPNPLNPQPATKQQ